MEMSAAVPFLRYPQVDFGTSGGREKKGISKQFDNEANHHQPTGDVIYIYVDMHTIAYTTYFC
jgi:hypothetical protein